MPQLFELYDKHRSQGLVIIGIHADLGENENQPVDSVASLDNRLDPIRKDLWNRRDIPFPVALVRGDRTAYTEGIELTARSKAAAEYGVIFYPTQVLIDRDGRIIGRFAVNLEDDVRRLERLLKATSDSKK